MEVVGGCGDICSLWKRGLLLYLDLSFIGFFLGGKRVNKSIVPWMGPIKCPHSHDQINTRCCEPRRCYLRDPWEMGGRLAFSKQRGLSWNLPISKQHIRTHAEQHQRTFRSCSSTKGTREYASSEAFIQHIYPLCTIEQVQLQLQLQQAQPQLQEQQQEQEHMSLTRRKHSRLHEMLFAKSRFAFWTLLHI